MYRDGLRYHFSNVSVGIGGELSPLSWITGRSASEPPDLAGFSAGYSLSLVIGAQIDVGLNGHVSGHAIWGQVGSTIHGGYTIVSNPEIDPDSYGPEIPTLAVDETLKPADPPDPLQPSVPQFDSVHPAPPPAEVPVKEMFDGASLSPAQQFMNSTRSAKRIANDDSVVTTGDILEHINKPQTRASLSPNRNIRGGNLAAQKYVPGGATQSLRSTYTSTPSSVRRSTNSNSLATPNTTLGSVGKNTNTTLGSVGKNTNTTLGSVGKKSVSGDAPAGAKTIGRSSERPNQTRTVAPGSRRTRGITAGANRNRPSAATKSAPSPRPTSRTTNTNTNKTTALRQKSHSLAAASHVVAHQAARPKPDNNGRLLD